MSDRGWCPKRGRKSSLEHARETTNQGHSLKAAGKEADLISIRRVLLLMRISLQKAERSPQTTRRLLTFVHFPKKKKKKEKLITCRLYHVKPAALGSTSQATISWFSLKCRQNAAWELTLGITIHVMQIPSLVRRKQNRPGFSPQTTSLVSFDSF